MRISRLTTSAGPSGVVPVGTVQDLPEEEAQDLVDRGYAIALESEDGAEHAPETATDAKRERAILQATRRRRGERV